MNIDTALIDADYDLIEGAAWFSANGFAIRIRPTDEGVCVDIYKDGEEMSEPLASARAALEL
jgi:hypothetical protein